MSDAPHSSTIPDADKKMADQLMMIGTIVAAAFAVLSILLAGGAGFVYLLIYGALAAALWFLGVTKVRTGDLQSSKMVALVAGVIMAVLGLIALTYGGLTSLLGLIGLGTAGALVYSAMLLSPGRKLF
jgi:hypothetical protein